MVKTTLLALLLALSGINVILWSQDPPEEPPSGNPGHIMPTEFCTPYNMPDGKMPCKCIHNQPNGCKDGKLDTEMRNCSSYCWKAFCHCCSS